MRVDMPIKSTYQSFTFFVFGRGVRVLGHLQDDFELLFVFKKQNI